MLQDVVAFERKIPVLIEAGRYRVETIQTTDSLKDAFRLRNLVFQIGMLGLDRLESDEDQDEFDLASDHLAVYETATNLLVATARLNCSLFSSRFYSQTEFACEPLLAREGVKLELGRVCVHPEFQKGIILLLLWKAIAAYMMSTKTEFLFGCGSVSTLDPHMAHLVYRHLESQGLVRLIDGIEPIGQFRSSEFESLSRQAHGPLTLEEAQSADVLVPALCKLYFNIGCYVAASPAFDKDFKCIDFLTVLETSKLDPKVRMKMMGF